MPASGREESAEPGRHAIVLHKAPAAFGKYQLFAALGRGGMADVFLSVARGPMGFNKLVVVKRLRPAHAEEPEFLDMFLDEARLAARLNHPNVVHTYEVGEHEGQYFIAMEYLDGQSLQGVQRVFEESDEPSSQGLCARIIADALAGLHHAHTLADYDGTPLHIVHRDISPHNVFVTYDGQVKLVDFGIAKATLSRTQTEVGVLKGKLAYMAPEQAMGGPIDHRADIFAMGIVLWELLTKQRLMAGESAAVTFHRLLNRPIPRASSVRPDVDPVLDDIVAKALEKDPEERFSTALAMREALDAWMVAAGATLRQDEVGARMRDWFAATRAEVRQQIQEQMARVEQATKADEASGGSLGRSRVTSTGNLPLIAIGEPSHSNSGVVQVPTISPAGAGDDRSAPGGSRGRTVLVLAATVVITAICVLGAVRLKQGAAPVIAPAAAAPPPTAMREEPPAPSAPAPEVSASGSAASAPAASAPAIASASPPVGAQHRSAGASQSSPAARPASAPQAAADPPPDVATAAPGFLTLDTVPWTHVSEGGRALGTTPVIAVSLSPGAHTLSLDNGDEGVHSSVTVTIKSGERTSRRMMLKQSQ